MTAIEIRKTVTVVEEVHREGGRELGTPLRLVAACVVVTNPYAGRFEADLSLLSSTYSETLGKALATVAASALDRPPRLYGKGALVGLAGEIEHGSAIIHGGPLGRELRAVTSGTALVPSVEKRGAAGTSFDVALRNATDTAEAGGTDLSSLFTMELRVSDAPHPDEIVVVAVLGDGPRPGRTIRGG